MSGPTLWISWRPAGTEGWHRHDLFGHWSEEMARNHFRTAVKHGSWEGMEAMRPHEARFYRHGVAVACWREDGRP